MADQVRKADANGSCSIDTKDEIIAYIELEQDCTMLNLDVYRRPEYSWAMPTVQKRRGKLHCS